MRRLTAIAFIFLIASPSPLRAADPREIFGTLLGELGRQIERQQQKKQLKRLRPLWTACSNGDVAACDRAAQFPNLTDQGRAQIWRMREAAEQRPAYERNFYACQKMDRAACQAALAYRYASDVDRASLQKWQRAANRQRQQALTQFRRNERNCYAGSVRACDAALTQRQLDESAATGIQRQRTQLLYAEEQRQRREQERQARERQTRAALRQYNGLRDRCVAGERAACQNAATHPQVPQADIAFLNRRDRELAPITERVVAFVADARSGGPNLGATTGGLLFPVLVLLAFIAAVVGVGRVLRNRATPPPASTNEPPGLAAMPPVEASPSFGGQIFPLTGHMPTDVRRALYGAQQ